ncbi:MAG: ATP-binding protein [Candidatus Pelagibacter sp.]|nr:ATP-binding protein [Candidatus Pelagibacter sp.]
MCVTTIALVSSLKGKNKVDYKKKINLNNFKDKIEVNSRFLKKKIDGVKKIVAISSAKGGVGKSTISANLAVACAKRNFSVGLLDADIYGPSIPDLFNVSEKPQIDKNKKILPVTVQKVKLISMGFLIDKNSPMIWRGPMVIKAIKSFVNNVNWGNLDCLFVDLPPGTGDAILTFAQELDVSSSIIITTPQKLSITDANRGIEMFRKTNIPVIGVIENMSYISNIDDKKYYPFGKDGAEKLCNDQNVKLLDKIRIDESFNVSVDDGIVFENLEDDLKNQFINISKEIIY